MRGRLVRHAAATALVAAACAVGVVGPGAAPAQAAPCTGSTGVTVVVDPGSLGGPVRQDCVSSSGRAAALFDAAGDALTYVTSQSGFVCRVNGAPASDPCDRTPPATAYWGLFWSDGKSGSWSYASSGVSGQIVPDGGYVAFAWQSGSGQDQPDVPATARSVTSTQAPSPTTATSAPTGRPSTRPTKKPTQRPAPSSPAQGTQGTSPSVAPTTPTPTPSATSEASADQTNGAPSPTTSAPTGSASSSASSGAVVPSSAPTSSAPTSAPTSPDVVSGPVEPASAGQSGTLPAWVVPLVLVLIAGGGVTTYAVRRRSRPSP